MGKSKLNKTNDRGSLINQIENQTSNYINS